MSLALKNTNEQFQVHFENGVALSDLDKAVIKTLAYAHVFRYPLNSVEILKGLTLKSDLFNVNSSVKRLHENKVIYSNGEYFGLSPIKGPIDKRIELNKRAQKYLPIAFKISRFIGNFPFVKAVCLSGSITKKSMAKDSDIDYFIITKPGRLWLTRTMLIAFKKIFLFNSYKLYCLNYFIDDSNLEIQNKNLFVAHEIKTLIPTYGLEIYRDFIRVNSWVNNYLPNEEKDKKHIAIENKTRGIKYFFEIILGGVLGQKLDVKFKSITEQYWTRKFRKKNAISLNEHFISKENISALHPENFNSSILLKYHKILEEQAQKLKITFN